MPVAKGPKGVAQEMRKFRAGKLHSGSKHGPIVTDRKQAIAIAMSEAGMKKKSGGKKPMAHAKPKGPGRGHGYMYGGIVKKGKTSVARGMGAAKRGGKFCE